MADWKRFSKWVVAASLVSVTAWAGTPVKSGESCFKSDPTCNSGKCDTTGAVQGSSCSGDSCYCITGVTCLTDADCSEGESCNAQYDCEANTDGSGSDGSGSDGTGFGCSSGGASLAALLPLVGLLRRRSNRSAKA
jgi:hypothetical protein